MLPLPRWMWSRIINPENGDKPGAQCGSLLLVCWTLSSGCRQISLGEWESVLLNPCITSTPATMVIAHEFIGKIRGVWGNSHKTGPVNKILLCSGFSLLNIHMKHTNPLTFWRDPSTNLCLDVLVI